MATALRQLRPFHGRQWRKNGFSLSTSTVLLNKPPSLANATTLRLFSYSRGGNAPGVGGRSEERHIATAIRKMKEMKPKFVIEVVNASNVGLVPRLFPGTSMVRDARVVLRILTHADVLSNAALRYQMAQAQHRERDRTDAVIALNLKESSAMKRKNLRNVTSAVFGGAQLASDRAALVCGIPNAGKSSLILPLSKDRTLSVRKKKSYHLPKVSSKAGWTLSTKRHVMETARGHAVTLIDTPGLRPRIDDADMETMALLIAVGAMEPSKGMLNGELKRLIVETLLKALNRHGAFMPSEEALPYVAAFGLDAPTEDPEEFLKASAKLLPRKGTGSLIDLIKECKTGRLGGLIFEEGPGRQQPNDSLNLNRTAPVLCMNDEARRLIALDSQIG